MHDVIIVGMGPAGMSAAIYAVRSGLDTLIIEKGTPGGLLNQTSKIDNYLGFSNATGTDVAISMFSHINDLKVPYKTEEVLNVRDEHDYKVVETDKGTYKSKAVILCAGRKAKTILDRESDYLGKGLSYCATCDAAFFKDKNVAIVGSGNSAFEEGAYLADFAKKLYILIRKDTIKADQILVDNLKAKGNVEILFNTKVENINLTNDRISSVVTNNGELEVEGLFIYAGYNASTHYLKDLDIKTENDYIIVDEDGRTNIPYIYAAGDAIKKNLYQVVTAVSEGAKAATSAKKDLSKQS